MDLRQVKTVRTVGLGVVVLGAMSLTACRAPDPEKELAVSDLEAYWVVDAPVGTEQYVAPALRLTVRNKGQESLHAISANAVFRRTGETEAWGSDWKRVMPAGKALEPGQSTLVVMKSDLRYHTNGPPQSIFEHQNFVDVNVDIFLKIGASTWTRFGNLGVERRIGSRTVAAEPAAEPSPRETPR